LPSGLSSPSGSSHMMGSPAETRSPTAILSSFTRPAAGDGTSIVAFSVSSVMSGSSGLTLSPGFPRTSTISTLEKSPRSGTTTSTAGRRSEGDGIGLLGVDAELLDRLTHRLAVEAAFVGQRVQRGQHDRMPIHLEEAAQG